MIGPWVLLRCTQKGTESDRGAVHSILIASNTLLLARAAIAAARVPCPPNHLLKLCSSIDFTGMQWHRASGCDAVVELVEALSEFLHLPLPRG